MNMTSKGQVTIPKAIRDQFGMDSTTDIEFAVQDGRVFLTAKKSVRDRFERVRGSADSGMTTEQILRLTRGEDD